ncbi:hypothetical protein CYY_005677 [Polysphondylium violaceum]|uniref:Ankyrin repeat-containing protein n=1 Tax=Polysphondylium violaceum TaxID=133409 RepID=A0A8J4PVY2_9MYCE|nr:hypothetical protein CYY_005677 [Polysphondylium violaceum]
MDALYQSVFRNTFLYRYILNHVKQETRYDEHVTLEEYRHTHRSARQYYSFTDLTIGVITKSIKNKKSVLREKLRCFFGLYLTDPIKYVEYCLSITSNADLVNLVSSGAVQSVEEMQLLYRQFPKEFQQYLLLNASCAWACGSVAVLEYLQNELECKVCPKTMGLTDFFKLIGTGGSVAVLEYFIQTFVIKHPKTTIDIEVLFSFYSDNKLHDFYLPVLKIVSLKNWTNINILMKVSVEKDDIVLAQQLVEQLKTRQSQLESTPLITLFHYDKGSIRVFNYYLESGIFSEHYYRLKYKLNFIAMQDNRQELMVFLEKYSSLVEPEHYYALSSVKDYQTFKLLESTIKPLPLSPQLLCYAATELRDLEFVKYLIETAGVRYSYECMDSTFEIISYFVSKGLLFDDFCVKRAYHGDLKCAEYLHDLSESHTSLVKMSSHSLNYAAQQGYKELVRYLIQFYRTDITTVKSVIDKDDAEVFQILYESIDDARELIYDPNISQICNSKPNIAAYFFLTRNFRDIPFPQDLHLLGTLHAMNKVDSVSLKKMLIKALDSNDKKRCRAIIETFNVQLSTRITIDEYLHHSMEVDLKHLYYHLVVSNNSLLFYLLSQDKQLFLVDSVSLKTILSNACLNQKLDVIKFLILYASACSKSTDQPTSTTTAYQEIYKTIVFLSIFYSVSYYEKDKLKHRGPNLILEYLVNDSFQLEYPLECAELVVKNKLIKVELHAQTLDKLFLTAMANFSPEQINILNNTYGITKEIITTYCPELNK